MQARFVVMVLLEPAKKEGRAMNQSLEIGYYELVYENTKYKFLEFIRLDMICNQSYVTLKHVMTREMFTFEEARIKKITKRVFIQQTLAKTCHSFL